MSLKLTPPQVYYVTNVWPEQVPAAKAEEMMAKDMDEAKRQWVTNGSYFQGCSSVFNALLAQGDLSAEQVLYVTKISPKPVTTAELRQDAGFMARFNALAEDDRRLHEAQAKTLTAMARSATDATAAAGEDEAPTP